jgi:hypothetical protein
MAQSKFNSWSGLYSAWEDQSHAKGVV